MATEYKKIMVTLDGSTFASQALPHAEKLARLYGAELILFQVASDAETVSQMLGARGSVFHVDKRQIDSVDEATETLKEMANKLNLQKIKTTPVVVVGRPAESIIDYAQENGVDLIVMTTHGRSGLARWVYGSVADKVLKGARRSVFLVRTELD